jgi:hypothetical protein
MTQEHLITPPPELVQQWLGEHFGTTVTGEVSAVEQHISTQAACWGADQQLEQCEKYWMTHGISPQGVVAMRYALRPKPLSLKEQALAIVTRGNQALTREEQSTIRRALESLPD